MSLLERVRPSRPDRPSSPDRPHRLHRLHRPDRPSGLDRGRPRRARPTRPTGHGGEDPTALEWWQPPVAGALAAVGSWLVLALPALLVWAITTLTTVGWLEAVGVAGAGWFLGHGAPVSAGPVGIWVTPLGLWALALLVTARSLRRLLDRTEAAAKGTTWRRLLGRRLLPGFAAGYAVFALLAWLLTLAGPARSPIWGVLVTLGVPAVAALWCLGQRHTGGKEAGVVGTWVEGLPRWATRAGGPGLWGAGLLLGLGTVLVVVMVLARLSTVTGLYAAVAPGLVGGIVLTMGQLLVLPNLAVWALAWLAGPGFSIADGSMVTLSGGRPGLLPMIPVLGALPPEGTWSQWLLAVLALPAVAGFAVAWRACRPVPRLASWRTKLATGAAAVLLSAVVVGALAVLSSGPAGVDRLRHVGVNPLFLTGALLAELLAGAVLYVIAAQLRLRLRRR